MEEYNGEFKVIDNEAKAYFCGFFHADGNLHYSKRAYSSSSKIKLAIKDKEILQRFEKEFPWFKLSDTQDNYEWDGEIRVNKKSLLRSYNKELYTDLTNLKVKTDIPKIPDSLFHHFLRGVIDGDGSYSKQIVDNKGYWSMTLCINHNHVKDFIDNWLGEFGINATCRVQGKIFIFRVRHQDELNMLVDLLYTDSTWYLKRKFDIVQQFKY